MKKTILLAGLACMLYLFVPWACKKSTHAEDKVADEALKNSLVNFINTQLINQSNNAKSFGDSLVENANWGGLEMKTINAHESVVYVPAALGQQSTGLVFVLRTDSRIVEQGFLLEIAGETGGLSGVSLMSAFYGYKSTQYDGLLKAYDFGNHFKWQLKYSHGRYVSRTSIMNSSQIDVNRLQHSTRIGRIVPPPTAGNNCYAWYLVTYYDDGSSDWDYIATTCDNCNMTRHIESSAGNFTTDCGGGGGGSGDSPTNVYQYDTVHNDLTDPCLSGVFNNMLGSGLNSELVTIFHNTFNTTDQVDYNITEVPVLSSGDALTTSSSSNGYTKVQTSLSQQEMVNASKEYIAETIFHEIIHGYLDANTNIKSEFNQHIEMINSYVDCELAALQEMFPSLTTHDGLCLILGGFGNVQLLDPTTLNNVMAHYQLSQNDISQTNNYFKTGNCGIRCNPGQPLN